MAAKSKILSFDDLTQEMPLRPACSRATKPIFRRKEELQWPATKKRMTRSAASRAYRIWEEEGRLSSAIPAIGNERVSA
jgi:hypothetical protein